MMEESRRLAAFVSRLSYEDLPRSVIEKTKDLVLDQIGCQLAGSTMPWSRAVYDYVAESRGTRGECTIVRYGTKTSPEDAAFANASFGSSLMGDDTDSVCHGHLGAIIISAALAVGEQAGVGGRELLKAVAVGYEVASRVGAASPGAERRGYHPGPLFGPFGAAAASGAILGFGEEEMLDVLGIAGSHAGGLMEYSLSGGTVNRVHAGIAAAGGIRAALLTRKGFKGPATILEGERGFVKAFSGEAALEEITRDLGQKFRVGIIDLKSHCCCGTLGSTIDAVSAIVRENRIDPKKIEEIVVHVSPAVYRLTGKIVRPRDITSGQFGGRFGVALRLIQGGNSFREYTEENLRDPEVLSLEAKTTMIVDDGLDKNPGADHPARAVIRTAGGKTYEATVLAPRGSVHNPMSRGEVHEKFRSFAAALLPPERIEPIVETVARMEEVKHVGELSRQLTSVRPSIPQGERR
jgi:2-methylcitrate dehydratase PrpD